VARGIYEAMSIEGGAATAGHRRSRELDAVRAVAALMVLTGHAYALSGAVADRTALDPVPVLVNTGGAGIWLFFALSGYLIAAPFLRALRDGAPLPSLGGYLLRRGARILPAYWVAFAALAVLVPVSMTWWQPLLHGVLLHNLVPGEAQALFFVAWTLGIELLFYLFVPVAAWAVRRAVGERPIAASALALGVVALWAASIAYAIWAAVSYPGFGATAAAGSDVARLTLPAMLSVFCPGLLVVLAEDAGWAGVRGLARRPLAALALAAPFALAGALLFTSESTVVFDLSRQPWAIAAGLVVIAALNGFGALGRAARWLAPAGLISYGLYLWHWVVVRVLVDRGVDAPGWPLRTLLVLAIAVPLATASWLLLERPLLRLTSRWWQGRRRSGTSGAPAGSALPASARRS
jgi:peptidoglycan/LPS O-acetylase OafA/YrhL